MYYLPGKDGSGQERKADAGVATEGLIVVDVDDLSTAGPPGGRHDVLMGDLRRRFTFGKWVSAKQEGTMYVGRRIRQLDDGTVLQDWEKYIRERLAPLEMTTERRREREAKSPS